MTALIERLRSRGWRLTAQRRVIAEATAGDHMHLVATLVRQDGRLPEMRGNWYRMRETCDRIEAELGLLLTRPSQAWTSQHARPRYQA